MPSTTRRAIPYPNGSSPVDVAGDLQDLAEHLDDIVGPAHATSLPGTPANLDEIAYQVDATNGIYWHLRYRSGSGSSYKWEYLGGPALYAEVTTSETTTSATYAALTTAGPAVTLPLAGDYDIEIGFEGSHTVAATTLTMSYDIGGTTASDNDAIEVHSPDANVIVSTVRTRRKTGLTAVALTAKYKTGAATGTFRKRWIKATPVRVG